jgi:hypothetical protein
LRIHALLRLLAVCGVALPSMVSAEPATFADRVDLSAETDLRWAIGTGRGFSQTAEVLFQPEAEIDLSEDITLTAIGRFRGDAFDVLEPGQPSQRERSHLSKRGILSPQADVELRELFVETTIAGTYLTVGKQQIVWGKADGLKVLDLVNPQSFREFILEDFEDSRIPLWAVNAEVPVGDAVVQLVWIPDQTYHELPEPDGVYAFTAPIFIPKAPPGVPIVVRPLAKPSRVLLDSDAGVRISTFWAGWDLTLNYLYYYDDFPIPFRRVTPPPSGPLVTVTPSYERSHLIGNTFSNAFGDLTVRGEFGYSTSRYFATSDSEDSDGVFKTGEFQYVLGFDWYGFTDTLLSAQVFQVWLTNEKSGSVRDSGTTTTSLLAQRRFMNERLTLETIWLQSLNNGDGLLRPSVRYELTDELLLRVGADYFYGTKNGLFGEFNSNDRVSFRLEWAI